ncbi:hypothetical protein KY284_007208 [Solanum tuberosum]|nr:hypothetical protein KY284_007208 [Solanum tuberosum]
MTLDFFTSLGSLLETICKASNVDDADHTFERLPDCLVIDILSRLPSHSFLRCRWVCRHWRALLVSSQDSFTNIHHLSRNTRPMFVIRDDFAKHDFAKHGQDLFVYGENENKKIKKKKVAFEKLHLKPELMINKNSKEEPNLLYSCEGVLMFASSSIALDHVARFKKGKKIAPCENGIKVFRMDKEELFTMPHPVSNNQNVCNSKQAHLAMTLMVKDDRLCFCNMLIPWYIVDMWLLEDYETRSWIKRYKINLLNERIFPFGKRLSEIRIRSAWDLKFLYIQEGELLIHLQTDSELYLYNLDRRTVKKLELPRGKMLSYTDCKLYHKSFLAIA